MAFDADFMVNASNTKLILGSGVSMAFKRHCGVELQHLMNNARSKIMRDGHVINQGDVIATSSAQAKNFKYALHAAVIKYGQGVKRLERKPSLETIECILCNTIPYLEWYSNKVNETIVIIFPYLGCGVGGLNKSDVLSVFEEFSSLNIKFDCIIKLCDFKQTQQVKPKHQEGLSLCSSLSTIASLSNLSFIYG